MSKYTDEQIANILKIYPSVEEMERTYAIRDAKQYLSDTDYVLIKIQEYTLLNKPIDNDYTEILEKREEARNVLRELEIIQNGKEVSKWER